MDNKEENIKVLIVQNDPKLLMNLELMVREEDLTPLVSKDGIDALRIIQSEHPYLVITEIALSGLDGISLCQLTKRDRRFKKTKFLFLTYLFEKEFENMAIQAGGEGVLLYPDDKDKILPQIQNAIGRCRWKGPKILWIDK